MNVSSETFGLRLARLRQEAGLSQQALADRLSVTRQAVSNWEREQTQPDLETLRATALALGTDLNTLMGLAPSAPKRRPWRPLLAGALLLCLCAVSFAAGHLSADPALSGGTASAPAGAETLSAPSPLPPHRVRYTTPGGTTVITDADGWQEVTELLSSLSDAGTGPVELTESQRDVFRHFASSSQYDLRFAPEYEGGVFSSWDDLLLWLYKAGISRGGIMARETVEEAVADLFGPQAQYTHQSTPRFPLTEEGYYPMDVASATEDVYRLRSLEKLPDGSFTAVLWDQAVSTVTISIAPAEDGWHIQSIARSDGAELSA